MGRAVLAQVVDREALDTAGGARARLRVAVPEAWARSRDSIEIAAPARVACARCDGGGCDGCARSGAHRTPADPAARALRVQLPPRVDGVVLRLIRPFGDDAPLDQLFLELAAADEPSAGVVRVPCLAPPRAARLPPAFALALLVSTLAALVAALALR